MTTETQKETLGFQAEVKQLLRLMIHSLYSNKEIFLRELISNASDACDKLRFEALSDGALYEGDSELKIRIAYDKDARTITLSDNGIGMSRNEVIENIGTIARSGTREFLDRMTGDQTKDANLIGQFGVGFYSSFIVADKVTLVTRRSGLTTEHGVQWESSGEGDYTLETVTKVTHGTEVTLHLREGEDDFLSDWRLQSIIRKYSDHITLPILMRLEGRDEDTAVNQANALWARPKSEISDEQYTEFYKHVAHDFEAPLAHVHSKVEGKQEYAMLLYAPAHAPFDMWDRQPRHGIKLYVRRVFIMEEMEKLMPHYLRFVRGVIDSNDLPLNVSREILQHSKDIDAIRAGASKKVLGMLEELAENDQEKYATFWREFGRVLKEGVGEDHANKERIAKLLRFVTTHADTEAEDVSLSGYVARLKEGQTKIYYVTADSFAAAKNSPHLEIFRKKGVEVILLHDRVDEWLVSNLPEFEGHALQSVAKGDLDLGQLDDAEEKQTRDAEQATYKEFVEKIQVSLGDLVKAVRISHRLTDSPACLVVDDQDMGMNLERMLKAAGQKVPLSKPILEVNPQHPLLALLQNEADAARFDDFSQILFNQALLAEGGQLEDPAGFVKKLNGLMLAMAGR
ncbi:MAG: molecular chaperone HtpG [Burkholderiales bacterium]|nr:molecular chaperone HtpG [Burkholderiales bacterium]